MTGAPRPHHRNIYCIINSAGPLVQGGEHINFHTRPSLLTRSCLLLKAAAPSRFLSLCFSFFCCFFQRPSGPRGLDTSSRPHLYLFHLSFRCFFFFLRFSRTCVRGLAGGRGGEPDPRRRDTARRSTKLGGGHCGGIKGLIDGKVRDSCCAAERGSGAPGATGEPRRCARLLACRTRMLGSEAARAASAWRYR